MPSDMGGKADMISEQRITLKWYGAAHYHMLYKDLRILIDPLYSRLPGDKPHLTEAKETLDRIDYLLLTHRHLDHAWDFPYLAMKYNPEIYAPEVCLADLQRAANRSNSEIDISKRHSLEETKGTTFTIADIDVTPYRIGTEEIDFWFIRSMFWRPVKHLSPGSVPTGLRWMFHHINCNCFAFHFRLPPDGKTMLYFGNLTEHVEELDKIDRVNVLAIPYCPANRKWLLHSQILIERFKPDVTMVHHFDNFMNPFTLSKYMNLDDYRKAIHERCPTAKFYFSKFQEEVEFDQIAGVGEKVAQL